MSLKIYNEQINRENNANKWLIQDRIMINTHEVY